MAAHKRLRTMANSAAAAAGSNSQDCAICLNSIAVGALGFLTVRDAVLTPE